MKQLLLTYLEQNTDRFAERYLCKRSPDLWKLILEATSFLPDNAMPKQRCWHVLHDVWEIPLCPTDNIQVNWFENRYLTYSSQSAKSRCPDYQKSKIQAYINRTGHEGHWSSNPEVRAQILEKRIANPPRGFIRSDTWRLKIKERWDEKLGVDRTDETIRDFKAYRRKVQRLTRRVYKYQRDAIQNHEHERSVEYHIDHIYSVFDGWKNKVPAEILAHPSNLRMLSRVDNSKKQHKSAKTLEQLLSDALD